MNQNTLEFISFFHVIYGLKKSAAAVNMPAAPNVTPISMLPAYFFTAEANFKLYFIF
jgi:hypothetical protein